MTTTWKCTNPWASSRLRHAELEMRTTLNVNLLKQPRMMDLHRLGSCGISYLENPSHDSNERITHLSRIRDISPKQSGGHPDKQPQAAHLFFDSPTLRFISMIPWPDRPRLRFCRGPDLLAASPCAGEGGSTTAWLTITSMKRKTEVTNKERYCVVGQEVEEKHLLTGGNIVQVWARRSAMLLIGHELPSVLLAVGTCDDAVVAIFDLDHDSEIDAERNEMTDLLQHAREQSCEGFTEPLHPVQQNALVQALLREQG